MKRAVELAKELLAVLENENTAAGDEEKGVLLSELSVGDVFKTEKGNFKVLEQMDGCTKVITCGLYRENVQYDDDTTDYKESDLRELCDGELYEEFCELFGEENIVEHAVDLTTVDMQKCFGTLKCKVRPLTFDEARQHNELLVDKNLQDWYWTCTPWSTKDRGLEYGVAVVAPAGGIFRSNCFDDNGVRPICILKSNIFVSKED